MSALNHSKYAAIQKDEHYSYIHVCMLALINLKMCVQPIVKPLPAYLSPTHDALAINTVCCYEILAGQCPTW